MSNIEIVYMLIALALGTMLCRFVPLVLPQKFLTHPILQKLNKMIPLAIMALLVLTSLSFPKSGENASVLIAQILAILIVLISYRWLNNVLLSVALGVLSLNGILWLI